MNTSTDRPTQSPDLSTKRTQPGGLQASVAGTATRLQKAYFSPADSVARGILAELRRGVGQTAERQPLIFQTAISSLTPPLTTEDLGRGDEPSHSEAAAFAALTLFAWHMQSATIPMHVEGRSLGSAVHLLLTNRSSQSLKPRFDALQLARSERARLNHARSLISILRSEGIGLDYGLFASDLQTLSSRHRNSVLIRWGRDLTAAKNDRHS